MKQIVSRKNKFFCIDKETLSKKARKEDIIAALYAAIYQEFSGAAYNTDYKDLTALERLNKVNEFANKWLSDRGLL